MTMQRLTSSFKVVIYDCPFSLFTDIASKYLQFQNVWFLHSKFYATQQRPSNKGANKRRGCAIVDDALLLRGGLGF